MDTPLYSVRMRASCRGQHLSGAERIVPETAVSEVTAALTGRAMGCAGSAPDEIYCSVERVDRDSVRYARLPDVATYQVNSWQDGHRLAGVLLSRAGVQVNVADKALQLLTRGAGPGGSVMRGAMIMDAGTGKRLEPDPSRGVRVSRMDLTLECRPGVEHEMLSLSLGHHRVIEALVLAGKVLCAPGIIAELCWSDSPEYTTGYVADPQGGYQRISALKSDGDPHGGRVFFVNLEGVSLTELVAYLELQAVLFDVPGKISEPLEWMSDNE
jgi:6-carboxyhexanoate--CoA ligase